MRKINTVKKYIIFIVLIAAFLFFQSSPFYENISLRGVTPDFLLIMISIAAFILGPNAGQIIGFITGFIVDIIPPVGLLGISAFTYTIIGYMVGIVGKKVYGNSVLLTVILLFIVTLIKALILSMLAAIFIQPKFFGYFVQGRVFLEAILNSVITPVLFIIITGIERKVAQ